MIEEEPSLTSPRGRGGGTGSGEGGALLPAVQHPEGVFHRATQQQKQQQLGVVGSQCVSGVDTEAGGGLKGGRPASRAERLGQGRQSPLHHRLSVN